MSVEILSRYIPAPPVSHMIFPEIVIFELEIPGYQSFKLGPVIKFYPGSAKDLIFHGFYLIFDPVYMPANIIFIIFRAVILLLPFLGAFGFQSL